VWAQIKRFSRRIANDALTNVIASGLIAVLAFGAFSVWQYWRDDSSAHADTEGVRRITYTMYEIDRSFMDRLLEKQIQPGQAASLMPIEKNGEPFGMVLGFAPSSLYAQIGLENGDIVHSINGSRLSSPDEALLAYATLKNASDLSVEVTRGSGRVTLRYLLK